MQYDCSRAALYHPELRPVFVDVDGMPHFEANNAGFSLVNAWWLSNMSHLAYYDTGCVEHELHKVGLRLVDSFVKASTQAFLVASDSFAVLVFRGTESDELVDLKTDADVRLASIQDGAKVHRGILTAIDKVWREIEGRLEEVAGQGLAVWYTGHSLGAALATLAATRRRPVGLFTFGSPRIGNEGLVQLFDGISVQRIVNCCDVVTTMPPRSLGYRHVGELQFITSAGRLLTNPTPRHIILSKAIGIVRYFSTSPWFRRGAVKMRSFADHAIVNYTSALGGAIAVGIP